MNQGESSLHSILALLDDGLSLYRRNFVGFVLITASWCVPLAIVSGLSVVAASWLEGGWPALLLLGAALLLVPLSIYLVGGLSRAAAAAAAGEPVRFRSAMAIRPLRAAGMGCFALLYSVAAQVVTSALSLLCICPLYVAGFAFAGVLAGSGAASAAPAGIVLFGVFLLGFYGSLMVSGASGSGLFYGLQPWVQESRSFGASLQRSVDLIAFRFLQNLAVWLLAALLLAAGGLTVTATIGTLLPLPLTYALGADSPVARAVSLGAWLIGLMVVLPPMPIWMALLYRRNRAAYEGEELAERVRVWETRDMRQET